jgi:phytoene synthase
MQQNYAYCEAEVRAHDKDRFLATLFAPADKRQHLFALYAFDHELSQVRERAKGPFAGEVRLQWWREAVEGQRTLEAAGNPVAAALIDTAERCALGRGRIAALVDAHTFDLYDEPMGSIADLEAYADAASGELIRLAATVLAGEAAPTIAATHAGRACAYVHILRTLPRHAARGQTYLPASLLERYGTDVGAIARREVTAPLSAALREMRELARREFDAAATRLNSAAPEAAPAFLPLAVVPLYLARMERANYDPFRAAVDVPQWRRQWALWRTARNGW